MRYSHDFLLALLVLSALLLDMLIRPAMFKKATIITIVIIISLRYNSCSSVSDLSYYRHTVGLAPYRFATDRLPIVPIP